MLITSLCGTREQRSRSQAHLSTPSPSAQVRGAAPRIRDRLKCAIQNKLSSHNNTPFCSSSKSLSIVFQLLSAALYKVVLVIHMVALIIQPVMDCGFYWFPLMGCAVQLPSLTAFLQLMWPTISLPSRF